MKDEQFKAVSNIESVGHESLITGDSDAAIKRQEKLGQEALVQSQHLPKTTLAHWQKVSAMQLYTAWGIEILREVDDLFYAVQLPPGWRIEFTEHSMWTQLLDEKNRERATIFYKAAFYDRKASITASCRYVAMTDYETIRPGRIAQVVDTATGVVLHEAGRVPNDEKGNWKEQDRLERLAKMWLDEHYPDNGNPLAYW